MGTRLNRQTQPYKFTECPYPPTQHQRVGIDKIVSDPYVFLTDEMGMGKSKQVIDAASILYRKNIIDRVVLVAPASVRSVWSDPDHGQLVTHGWPTISNLVSIYHRRESWFTFGPEENHWLEWLVTNYEYIRRNPANNLKLEKLLKRCDDRTLLILDESSYVKSTKAAQTKACRRLRNRCGRVVLLTGTPIAHSLLDLLSQANLLHPSILSEVKGEPMGLTRFRAEYCIMGGFQGKHILEFKNKDKLRQKLKPFTLRRLKKDCLDLPPKLSPVALTATLSSESWALYKEMRNHALVELGGEVSVARHAVTKLIRLSQLTSGFIGGVSGDSLRDTGNEKLQVLSDWVSAQLEANPCFKLVIWTQFRHDVDRVVDVLENLDVQHQNKKIPVEIGRLWGNTSTTEREHVLQLLHPETAPTGAAIVVGTQQTGAFGITLAAASSVLYLNNPFSLNIRLQSEDRVHRPGQTGKSVSYFEIVAEGPQGQRTIDHLIHKALRDKRELAEWTASAWRDALQQQKTIGPSS